MKPKKRTLNLIRCVNDRYDPKQEPELKFYYRVKSAQNTLIPGVGDRLSFYQVNQLIHEGVTVNVAEAKSKS